LAVAIKALVAVTETTTIRRLLAIHVVVTTVTVVVVISVPAGGFPWPGERQSSRAGRVQPPAAFASSLCG
jgi:hypothetical protein